MKLKDAVLKAITPREKEFKLSDGASLFLLVKPSGVKTWIYLYRFDGKQKKLTIGQYPQVSLKKARDARQEARTLLDQGIDPVLDKKKQTSIKRHNLFANVAEDWFTLYKVNKAARTLHVYRRVLDQYILPAIGREDIKKISRVQLANLIKENTVLTIESNKALYKNKIPVSLALKICSCLSMIFDYALNIGVIEYSVASRLSSVLPAPNYQNLRTLLKHDDVKLLLQCIRSQGYAGKSVWFFLNIMPYVFVRNTELRLAKWCEFDLEKKEWHIPPERMKGQKAHKQGQSPHFVPLASQVVDLLLELKKDAKSDYLFPAAYHCNKCITDNAPLIALKRFELPQTVHGFRTIASTYLHELKFPTHIIEMQLAHKDTNKIRAVYNKAEYKAERIDMMQAWADYLDALREA